MTTPIIQSVFPCPLLHYAPTGVELPAWLGDRVARKFPSDGPDGKTGTLASVLDGSLEYLPDVQTWVPVVGTGTFIGFQPLEGGIDPARFARTVQHPGHAAKLGDGQEWIIPCARMAAGGTSLPKRRSFDPAGNVSWQVETAFRGLTDFAAQCWDARRGITVAMTDADLDRWCGEALSVNYCLHWPEAVAMGLFTDDALRNIVSALIDWPSVEALVADQKKTSGG